ncbi:MAG TPA: enoyl-CoA hydratase-related protein [Streptosporangiaceae bacterium]
MGSPQISDDEHGTRWITIDRPEIANALRLADLDVVAGAVTGAGPGIRAIVITGAGERSFSAGMHVDTFSAAGRGGGREVISRVRDCVGAVRLSPLPTIAMVNGYCLGAAFELALACDLRVACPDARFGLPEVRLGIPSVVDAALLHHYVGLSRAREIILTGGMYSVADLAPSGLANKVAERPLLRAAVEELLAGLRALTPQVIAAQKALFETWLNTGLQASIDASVQVFADVFADPATAAAIAAYQREFRRR